jgi:TnpA family transposase
MSWRRLAPHIYSVAKVTATGAGITLGSTVFSCYLAVQIEAAGHQTLFTFFPHWYHNVEHANGIDPDLLASVRMQAKLKQLDEEKILLKTLQQQQQQQATNQAAMENIDRTKTVFTIERLVDPAIKQVQELTFINDLSACAMTS